MADKIHVIECLAKAQGLQRIATKCVVFIENDPFEEGVNITLISECGDIFIYKFGYNYSFMKNRDELQRLENKFNLLNGKQDD